MFKKKAIDEWALDYWLLQQYAKLCIRIFYRRIEVINKHNIPVNQPVILAPNHQNALMDAMILVCNTPLQNVFLARADIFKGRLLIRFLTFMNIMPIYRKRDGIVNVKKNDVVFEKTIQVLHNRNNPLCLFAEGNHGDKHRLRPLVKGLFRIALQAQEKYGNKPGVKIVPIGYEYGHYENFRSTIFINIGQPIEISEFYEIYQENPVTGINTLKDKFAAALSHQMIDIQTEEFYDLYMRMREVYNDEMRLQLGIKSKTLAARHKADKIMIDALNQELEKNVDSLRQLNAMKDNYYKLLKKLKLRDWVLKKEKYSFTELIFTAVLKLVLLPVVIFGLLGNGLPYFFTGFNGNKIKDPQFRSSFKYVIGMIAFPVWYAILIAVLAIFSVPFLEILLCIVLLPLSGLIAFHYYIHLIKYTAKWRYTIQRKKPDFLQIRDLRNRIIERMYRLIKPQIMLNGNQR